MPEALVAIRLIDGALASPGLSFGSSVTGLFSPASNQMAIVTNSLERGRWTNLGLGIGKTPAAEKLEVAGAIVIGAAAGTADGTLRWTGSDFEGRKGGEWVSFTTNASAGGWTDDGAVVRLSDIGDNVGMGIAVAAAKLHVLKTTEQLRLAYDATHYLATTVDSLGNVSHTVTGVGNSVRGFNIRADITSNDVLLILRTIKGGESSEGIDFNDFDSGTVARISVATSTGMRLGSVLAGKGLTLTSGLSVPRLTFDGDGNTVWNENGLSVDYRFEGNTDTNLTFMDGSTDRVGHGTNTPLQKLHVIGRGIFSTGLSVGSTSTTYKFEVHDTNPPFGRVMLLSAGGQNKTVGFQTLNSEGEWNWFHTNNGADLQISDGTNARIFIKRADGNIGMGTNIPAQRLHVIGRGIFSAGLSIGSTSTAFAVDLTTTHGNGYRLKYSNNNRQDWRFGTVDFTDIFSFSLPFINDVVTPAGERQAIGIRGYQSASVPAGLIVGHASLASNQLFRVVDGNGGSPLNYLIIHVDGNTVFNEDGVATADFRHEGEADTHLLFSDAGTNKVAIGSATTNAKLNVLSTTEQLRLNYDSGNYNAWTVTSNGQVSLKMVGTTGAIRQFTVQSAQANTRMAIFSAVGGSTGEILFFANNDQGNRAVLDMSNNQFIVGTTHASNNLVLMTGNSIHILAFDNIGNTVWNEPGNDVDARFEGASDTNLFRLDGGLDAAAFGMTPVAGKKLTVSGIVRVLDAVEVGNAKAIEFYGTTGGGFGNKEGAIRSENTNLLIESFGSAGIHFRTAGGEIFATDTIKSTDQVGDLVTDRGFEANWREANATANAFYLTKSRNNAIVLDGDELGRVEWRGHDGVDLLTAGAQIIASVDGTPGANDLPTKLNFLVTPDGSNTPVSALLFRQNGNAGLGVDPNERLTVGGVISLEETSAPSLTAGFGKVYAKSSDSELYFLRDDGVETKLTEAGSAVDSVARLLAMF